MRLPRQAPVIMPLSPLHCTLCCFSSAVPQANTARMYVQSCPSPNSNNAVRHPLPPSLQRFVDGAQRPVLVVPTAEDVELVVVVGSWGGDVLLWWCSPFLHRCCFMCRRGGVRIYTDAQLPILGCSFSIILAPMPPHFSHIISVRVFFFSTHMLKLPTYLRDSLH